jgi:hypothetical protein
MRTLRLSLVGTVIFALLAGMAGTVLARTDGSTKVTGSVAWSGMGDPTGFEFTEEGVIGEDWIGHGRGMKVQVGFEWSDPRLPTQAEMVLNFDAYGSEADGDVGARPSSSTWLLEDSDGSWSGPWTGWCDDEEHCRGLVTLTGLGAYEGFYAVLTEQPREDEDGTITQMFEGGIFAGEMPPVPAPPEPTTE